MLSQVSCQVHLRRVEVCNPAYLVVAVMWVEEAEEVVRNVAERMRDKSVHMRARMRVMASVCVVVARVARSMS